jgi:membrane-bound serine protease (ClpP class)
MVWLVVLLAVVGIGLIMSEIFVPGGVLGFLGLCALVASIVIAATHFSAAGIIATVALIAVAGVGAWLFTFRVLRKTRMARGIFLSTTQQGISVLSGTAEQYKRLIGKRGVAQSYLRPAGVADIDGERVDVVTEGEYVPAGTPIEVIELEANHLVVRAVQDERQEEHAT